MKTHIYLVLVISVLLGCKFGDKNDVYNDDDFDFLHNEDVSITESIKQIDNVVSLIDNISLDSTLRKEYANRVNFEYIVYTYKGKPVKATSVLNENTYTVEATYYIHENLPYYIKGTMRDRDRASGNYTHKELATYLNGEKVLRRLQRTGINQENRASDLSQMPQEDITHTIYSPELDAENRYKEVMKILGTPID